MNPTAKKILYIVSFLLISVGGFYAGKTMSYDNGYFKGAIFADSSGYKRGFQYGFEEGFKLRDSIAAKEKKLRDSEQFNLDIIYSELGNPEEYIKVNGEVIEKESKESLFSAKYDRYVDISVQSLASYVRYKDMIVKVQFLDKRKQNLNHKVFIMDDILYPRKSIHLVIAKNEVPDQVSSVNVTLEKAEAIE